MTTATAVGDSDHLPFKLHNQGLLISRKAATWTVPWHDVVGCHVERGSPTNMLIYTYPAGRKHRRSRFVHKLPVVNFSVAKHHQASLLNVLRSRQFGSLSSLELDTSSSSDTTNSNNMTFFRNFNRPILVLINPASGSGNAYQLFLNHVNPVLADADVPYQLMLTRSVDHARDLVIHTDLSSISGIVIVSGDGMFFEVINSLMSRLDADTAIAHTPVGIIPAGSGNAIISSLLSYIGEFHADKLLLHAAFSLVKSDMNHLVEMDLAEVRLTGVQQPIYCALSVTWGVVADVDAESERYRMFGGARFGLVFVSKMLSLHGFKSYHGRLTYCPLELDSSDLLPSGVTDPLPNDWVVEEGNWCTVAACLLSHLAQDFVPCPAARPDDGCFHIVLVPGPCSRRNFLRMFTGCSDGSRSMEGIGGARIIRTRAFRLEPLTEEGHIMVDGEPVSYGTVQAKVLARKARFFLSKPLVSNGASNSTT